MRAGTSGEKSSLFYQLQSPHINFPISFYRIFDRFAAVGAEGTGHDCIDAMMLMLAMKNVWIGIVVIAAVFVLLSVLKAKREKAV